MTALPEYQRLECQGLWRDGPGAQRREVIVAFGDATLVIADARSDRALAHWSLPAVLRRNPGHEPAVYAPGTDAAEDLEIGDTAMIAAIAKVHAMIGAQRPHPGRLRGWLAAIVLAIFAAGAAFWLPGALIRQTAAALPEATRIAIGEAVLADIARRTGAPCAAPEGRAALARLAAATTGPRGRIVVLPGAPAAGVPTTGVLRLPGAIFVLDRALIEAEEAPDRAIAGLQAAAAARDDTADIADFLRHAGLAATLRLLTTGGLPAGAATGYGAALVARPPATLPAGGTAASVTVLEDADWVALQGICGG